MLPQPSVSQVTTTSIITTPSTTAPIQITTTGNTTSATTPSPSPTPTLTETPTPTPTPTNNATPAPGPAAAITRPKRPAASDLQRIAGTSATPSNTPNPNKRQATASGNYNVRSIPIPAERAAASSHPQPLFRQSSQAMMPAPAPAPALITEDQLHGRTPEQLIATILQLQNQHQQVFAQISAQYDNINQQLHDLRGSLIASHQAAASALMNPRDMRPIVSQPSQHTAIPPPPRPPTQMQMQMQMQPQTQTQTQLRTDTPTRAPRVPPASPSHPLVPRSSVSSATPTTAAVPPQYDYRTVSTVEEVWKEYREGVDGQPAVEQLDALWGSRWRPEPRGRTWYSRRKVIWDKIKDYMTEGLDEEAAVQEVEKLREGGTINKLIKLLQDERKDKGIGDDGMVS